MDADLSSYFDTIPHAELLSSLARRIADGAMLHLLKMWLETAVEEADERGNKRRSTRNRDEGRGTPQGSPISPLLSNLYMRRLVLGWKKLGHETRLRAYIVNYADDLVICCRSQAADSLEAMRSMMAKLKLTVNEAKTRVCRCRRRSSTFWDTRSGGATRSRRDGPTWAPPRPRSACSACVMRLAQNTGRNQLLLTSEQMVQRLNRMMTGWANYFCLGPVSKAYRAVDAHARQRLRRWLAAKHKQQRVSPMQYPDDRLYDEFGLLRLTRRTANFPWAKA